MLELVFCDKCGFMTSAFSKGQKCFKCCEGHFVGTGVDEFEAENEIIKEYFDVHGEQPTPDKVEELIKQKYIYGKLDVDLSEKAIKRRQEFDTPEHQEKLKQIAKFAPQKSSNNISKCPTCGSTNIRKISTGERMVSVGMLGLFSKKINKSFKCNSCGYTL